MTDEYAAVATEADAEVAEAVWAQREATSTLSRHTDTLVCL